VAGNRWQVSGSLLAQLLYQPSEHSSNFLTCLEYWSNFTIDKIVEPGGYQKMCFQFFERSVRYRKVLEVFTEILLPCPSAIFAGMETAALRIWLINL
jgi:hypothetical protein